MLPKKDYLKSTNAKHMRNILLPAALCFLGLFAAAQTPASKTDTSYTLSPEATRDLLNQLNIDSTAFLKNSGQQACGCIDSVKLVGGSKKELLKNITACIDEHVVSYQMALKLMRSMKSPGGNISLSTDAEDPEYKEYYYRLETWLKSNCKSLGAAMAINDDKTSTSSVSNNKKAREEYDKGTEYLHKEEYSDAIRWLEKCIKTDPDFAFAWDNLGIAYRRTNKLDKAIHAYQVSLLIDSMGRTPLQNLPVAFGLLGRADEAIAAYKTLLARYPGDPEAYYGLGQIYMNNKKDYEAATDNLCQAYRIYLSQRSPYRADAEQLIATLYRQMKSDGKEAAFIAILRKYDLNPR
jgi:tetratricopeptide (TPR) repeat protein